MITIEKVNGTTFTVTVNKKRLTTHTVTVSPAYCQRLTDGRVSIEILLRKTFEFLLERESNTSILSSFDLPVVGRYFPEYESTVKGML